jgi:hypothetical protein
MILHLNYEIFIFDIFEPIAKTMVVLVMEINAQLLYPVLDPSCWHNELISLSFRVIGFHALYARFSLPGMVKHQDRTLNVHTMIAQRLHFVCFHFIHSDWFLLLLPSKPRTVLSRPCYRPVIFVMAPVV